MPFLLHAATRTSTDHDAATEMVPLMDELRQLVNAHQHIYTALGRRTMAQYPDKGAVCR